MTKLIPLTQGKVALVDDADYDYLMQWGWWAHRRGRGLYYATRHVPGDTTMHMHNQLTPPPDGFIVDHINGNGLDNRRVNLRFATQQNNCHNRRKNTNGSSQYKGVQWHKKSGKWYAGICVSYKKIHLGSFTNEEDAARAYDTAARQYFGEFARTNF